MSDLLELAQDDPVTVNVREVTVYLSCLSRMHSAIKEAAAMPENLEGQERIDYLTSCRNKGLAHNSPLENAFAGNLDTEPTTTVEELVARGTKEEEAIMLISKRDLFGSALRGLI